MDALSKWLRDLGLECYVDVFAKNDGDFDAVGLLSYADLERLGISLGHRRKLLRAIAELNGEEAGAAAGRKTVPAQPSDEPVRADGERRQLTVLFCDMVGYTELASRLDSEILEGIAVSLKGDLAGAERNYLVSLDWARRQQAKSWELRTSTSLARLWQRRGKRKEAHELLTPVYNWFTEGFDTRDLNEAKALRAELAP